MLFSLSGPPDLDAAGSAGSVTIMNDQHFHDAMFNSWHTEARFKAMRLLDSLIDPAIAASYHPALRRDLRLAATAILRTPLVEFSKQQEQELAEAFAEVNAHRAAETHAAASLAEPESSPVAAITDPAPTPASIIAPDPTLADPIFPTNHASLAASLTTRAGSAAAARPPSRARHRPLKPAHPPPPMIAA